MNRRLQRCVATSVVAGIGVVGMAGSAAADTPSPAGLEPPRLAERIATGVVAPNLERQVNLDLISQFRGCDACRSGLDRILVEDPRILEELGRVELGG